MNVLFVRFSCTAQYSLNLHYVTKTAQNCKKNLAAQYAKCYCLCYTLNDAKCCVIGTLFSNVDTARMKPFFRGGGGGNLN
jgi:hypothetical protein